MFAQKIINDEQVLTPAVVKIAKPAIETPVLNISPVKVVEQPVLKVEQSIYSAPVVERTPATTQEAQQIIREVEKKKFIWDSFQKLGRG